MEKFLKLKDVTQFTVKSVGRPHFQKWDQETNKMLKDPQYVEGYKKVWEVSTEEGLLTLSKDQMGQMLIAFLDNGKSEVVGKTFKVKTNGKEGMEIRYFINGVYGEPVEKKSFVEELPEMKKKHEEIEEKLDDLPF